jgi:hypothetical protein
MFIPKVLDQNINRLARQKLDWLEKNDFQQELGQQHLLILQ